ncbi:SH3 domain-containing protein [Streptomyces sp. NPDC015171]|uniref:SH3 domain-containing protein n=1 Tax=Streptomyces sp. NPDC015171 TaxID=3364945 RepID=UPI0036F959C7
MKRLFLTAAVAVAIPCAVAVPHASAGTPEQPPATMARAGFSECGYQVTADGVRLRTGPSTRAAALGLLHRGDTVYATQARGGWYKVRLAYDSGSEFGTRKSSGLAEGTAGWLAKRYVHPNVCTQIN